jgi:serine/threonine protein kinase
MASQDARNQPPHDLLGRSSEVLDEVAGGLALDTEDPLLTELRGFTSIADPETDVRADALVERLRQANPALSTCAGPAQTVPELPMPLPERFEYFRVETELGRGGMGTVNLALDTRLNRQVAIKTLRDDLSRDPRYKERFLREGRAAAAVDHPNVVPIHYVGESNGVPFLAMPLLKGDSLESWLKKRPQAPAMRTCVRIVRQIAAGLAAFHQQGMIHRDLKPSNIWIEPTDGDDVRVKILDFGLARAVGGDQPLTETGAILGTPAYMAPEQARGVAVDQRADLFSLGCVLYQLITLKRPFDGADTLATLLCLAVETPREPALVNRECPRALSQLTMELLAKEPTERPADVRQVIARLTTIENGLASIKVRKPRPRKRTLVAVGLLLLAALLGSGIYIVTDTGTIAIATDAPGVKVILEDDGGRVTILDPESKQSWRINTGTYKVRVDGDDREIDLPGTFQVKRGDRILATIRTVKPRPKVGSPEVFENDRAIAEKMLLLGGSVMVENHVKATLVENIRDLPAGELRLLEVNFFGNKDLKDSDLEALKSAKSLWNVNLSHTRITNDGLKHLVGLPKMIGLHLDATLVTNAGLPALKACAQLKVLGLSFSKVTEAGLAHVKELPQLEGLGLCSLGITDAGLAQLRDLKNLQSLGLDQSPISDGGLEHLQALTNLKILGLATTQVTEEGARKLAKSLTKCKIVFEGGVITPMMSPGNGETSPSKEQ